MVWSGAAALTEGTSGGFGLEATEPDWLPSVLPQRPFMPPQLGVPTGLIVTEADSRIEDFGLAAFEIRTAAAPTKSYLRSSLPVADCVARFEAAVPIDTATRVGASLPKLQADAPDDFVDWAASADRHDLCHLQATARLVGRSCTRSGGAWHHSERMTPRLGPRDLVPRHRHMCCLVASFSKLLTTIVFTARPNHIWTDQGVIHALTEFMQAGADCHPVLSHT
jgi:hypothetical protein